MAPSRLRASTLPRTSKPVPVKQYPAKLSPKITRSSVKREENRTKAPEKSQPVIKITLKKREIPVTVTEAKPRISNQPSQTCFTSFIFQHLGPKQQAGLSDDLRDKVNKVGSSLIALAVARKELTETDAKVAQLEETYGKTMKIQDVWRYQERAGLAAIIGQDPQAVMNAPHIFQEEERLMYNSGYPRQTVQAETTVSREPSPSPPPTRLTRSQLLLKDERLSTDDED